MEDHLLWSLKKSGEFDVRDRPDHSRPFHLLIVWLSATEGKRGKKELSTWETELVNDKTVWRDFYTGQRLDSWKKPYGRSKDTKIYKIIFHERNHKNRNSFHLNPVLSTSMRILTFTFAIQRAILETCDHRDIWSVWWGDITWLRKTYQIPKIWKFSEIQRIVRNFENFPKFWEFSDILRIFRKSQFFQKILKFTTYKHSETGMTLLICPWPVKRDCGHALRRPLCCFGLRSHRHSLLQPRWLILFRSNPTTGKILYILELFEGNSHFNADAYMYQV